MSKWFSQSNTFPASSANFGRRGLASQLAFMTVLVSLAHLESKSVVAAEENSVLQGDVYARLKASFLVVMLDGQLKGSGALVDATGLAITAAHAIGQKGSRLEVLTASAERLRVEVVAVDLGHDLALLRLPAREGGYPFLPLADRPPQPGETLFCLGQPANLSVAILFHAVLANEVPTFIQILSDYVPAHALQGNMPGGTSGGPWVDNKGKLVAVQFGILQNNNTPIGVAFASPVSAVQQLLATRKNAATPYAGMVISELWRQPPHFFRLFPPQSEGLFITSITLNQPAARAGLKQWDLMIEAEGRPIRFLDEFLLVVRRKKPGERLSVAIMEPGATKKRDVIITLGLMEASWR